MRIKRKILDASKLAGPTWRAAVYNDPRDGKMHVAPMLAVDKQAAIEMATWWHSYLTERYGRVSPLGAVDPTEGV